MTSNKEWDNRFKIGENHSQKTKLNKLMGFCKCARPEPNTSGHICLNCRTRLK
jgi:hypothetical protein